MDESDKRERLAQLGELVGSVLHELRNPLGVIESSLYLIRQKPDDAPRRHKHLQRIGEQVTRARNVIAGLMSLLHDQPLDMEPLSLARVVSETISTIEARVPIDVALEGAPHVLAEPTLLRQAIGNLIDNALRAATTQVNVSARCPDNNQIELVVQDDGAGVSPEMLAQLFQPLATSRADGTGLGLALSRRIAERLGGSLRYEAGTGARFVLTLQVAA